MAHKATQVADARILVVEDDENNRIVAIKLLQLVGVQPNHIVSFEKDPMPHLPAQMPQGADLVLLDLQLPEKDGYQILAVMKADPVWRNVPIVAMTANVMLKDLDKARMAGFDGFIGKPISAMRFAEWIRRILDGEEVWSAQ